MSEHIDKLLLLYCVRGASPVFGRLKLQKTHFLVEFALREADLVGPHFPFFRHYNGPYSQRLWDYADSLKDRRLLIEDEGFRLTNRGQFVLDLAVPPLAERNREMFSVIDAQLTYCATRTGDALMNHVYDLEIIPDGDILTTKIRDIPQGVPILAPSESCGPIVDADLRELISDALSVTEEDLANSRARGPEIDKKIRDNVLEALT